MAHQHPIKVLVTGFGPFPGIHDNPSGDLVRRIKQERLRLPQDITLHATIIPTSWAVVEQFVQKDLAEFDPDIALHFGVSSRAHGFRIEQVARNTASTAADCERKTFGRPHLANGGSPILHASIDAERTAQRLRKRGLEACASRDAGRYLCNMLLYLSLNQLLECRSVRQTGFIHIPPLKGSSHHAAVFDIADLLTGVRTIINHCIGEQLRLNRGIRKAA